VFPEHSSDALQPVGRYYDVIVDEGEDFTLCCLRTYVSAHQKTGALEPLSTTITSNSTSSVIWLARDERVLFNKLARFKVGTITEINIEISY